MLLQRQSIYCFKVSKWLETVGFFLLNIFLNLASKYLLYILLDLLLLHHPHSYGACASGTRHSKYFQLSKSKSDSQVKMFFMTMSKQFISVSGFRNTFLAVLSFLRQIFMTMTLSHQMAEITWKSIKMSEGISEKISKSQMGPSSQLPSTHENFRITNKNAATICHSFR